MTWQNPWVTHRTLGARLVTFPAYALWCLFGLVSGWVQTRRVSRLLGGLPALILAGVMGVVGIDSRAGISPEVSNHYLQRANSAIERSDLPKAEFFLNRLESLGYRNDRTLSVQAQVAGLRQLTEWTEDIYREMLTNSDRTGDGLAHRQLGKFALARSKSTESADFQEAVAHFQDALISQPRDLLCHEMLARAELIRGNIEEGTKHLEIVASARPGIYLDLARIYEQAGNPTQKSFAASQAERFFEKIAKEGLPAPEEPVAQKPTDGKPESTLSDPEAVPPSPEKDPAAIDRDVRVQAHLDWAETLVMQGKLKPALAALTSGEEKHKHEALRSRLASVYIREINELPQTNAAWKTRWELVALCRHYAPESKEAMVVLGNIAVKGPPELADQARKIIDPLLDIGEAPSAVYFLMGTHAVQNKQWDRAERLLRIAVDKEPRADIGWNNLAFLYLTREHPNLDEAEKCVDKALSLNPAPPTYHETRGQIMLKLGRWTETVRELELALTNMTANGEIHFGLAVAYEHLEDFDLAEMHRSRAKGLGYEVQPVGVSLEQK